MKLEYGLTVDQQEAVALEALQEGCRIEERSTALPTGTVPMNRHLDRSRLQRELDFHVATNMLGPPRAVGAEGPYSDGRRAGRLARAARCCPPRGRPCLSNSSCCSKRRQPHRTDRRGSGRHRETRRFWPNWPVSTDRREKPAHNGAVTRVRSSKVESPSTPGIRRAGWIGALGVEPATIPARCPVVGKAFCYFHDCHHSQRSGCVHPEAVRPRRRRRRLITPGRRPGS